MDLATDRIEQHIDRERELLRSNLEELEDRVRSAIDWRRRFRSNPAAWLAAAFAGGLLIALTAERHTEGAAGFEHRPGGERAAGLSDHRRREISRAWRTIESALIGLAAAKLKDTLANVLPGFKEQLARREGDAHQHRASAKHHS